MKNIINYYYNLDCTELRMIGKNYLFKYDNDFFLFCDLSQTNVDDLLSLLRQVQSIPYIHTAIYNKNKQIITSDGINNYILFKININQNRYIQMNDVLHLYFDGSVFLTSKYNNNFNWVNLWSEKVDYLEYYINLKDNIDDEIKCIFNYFIGLSENAISYMKKIFETTKHTENDKLSIVHKRLSYKYTLYDLYNPLNFVVDHISRDISEYIKSLFWDRNYNSNIIDAVIKQSNLSEFGYKILFGRMIFPTFFFDLLDKYELNQFSSREMLNIFDRTKEYEEYILLIYNSIKKTRNINIPRINWLGK